MNKLYNPTANEIIVEGEYKHRRYWIVAYHGHPNAYVEICDHDRVQDEDIQYLPLNVHGGVTFGGHLPKLPARQVVGWDYAHYSDYTNEQVLGLDYARYGIHIDDETTTQERVWTVEEIQRECIYACGQLDSLEF